MLQLIINITIAYIAGIFCAGYIKVIQSILLILYSIGCSLLLVTSYLVYKQKATKLVLVSLFFIIGMIRCIHSTVILPTDISLYAGQNVTIYGVVKEIPQLTNLDAANNKVKYLVNVEHVQAEKNEIQPASGVISITTKQSADMTIGRQGDKVSVQGEVQKLTGYKNPGIYDSIAAAKLQGITARMFAKPQDFTIITSNNSRSLDEVFAIWRQKILNNLHNVMPPSDAAILFGMLFGGYNDIPHEVVKSFAITGIVHILSVSGSHIALVIGIITALGKVLEKNCLLNDKVFPVIAMITVISYSLFCGLIPPVVRSLIMGVIALGAITLERESNVTIALFIAALGMLVYQPGLIYDISFQLSFGCTAGLIFLYPKIVSKLKRFPPFIRDAIAITISAQLGVLPFVAWYFNSFSISSLLANMIIVPVIEVLVVLGLFGSFAGLLVNVVGNIFLVICSVMIKIVVVLAEYMASLPGAAIYIPSIGIAGGIIYYVLLTWIFGYHPKWILSFKEVLNKYFYCSVTAVFCLIAMVMVYNFYPKDVYVHFIDVGQGDAMLIVTPHGRAVLIDTGGTIGDNANFDVGERVVLPYLRHYGIGRLDYLFLTHNHQDHAGGAAAIASSLPVKNIMLPREDYNKAINSLLAAAQGSCIIPTYDGQKISLDNVVIEVLHAVDGSNLKTNESSTVVKVSYGEHSFLVTGDLEQIGENQLLNEHKNIQSTVLKVGHHGAKTSSTPQFLQAVDAKYAVISVGQNNSFGHPHKETLGKLISQNMRIYRTDQQGAVVFRTDGRIMNVDTFVRGGSL